MIKLRLKTSTTVKITKETTSASLERDKAKRNGKIFINGKIKGKNGEIQLDGKTFLMKAKIIDGLISAPHHPSLRWYVGSPYTNLVRAGRDWCGGGNTRIRWEK